MLADDSVIHKIISQIEQKLPSGLKLWKNEISSILKVVVTENLSQFNWVSRHEFELQQQLLEKTRIKLEQLVQQVEQLERAKEKNTSSEKTSASTAVQQCSP
jgi:ubiquinone biosynthesis accessory factor UbiK